MLVYATAEDLTAWGVTPAPTEAAAPALIRSASILARRATITAVYDVDDDGAPTDTVVAAAFKDAVCSQVGTWVALAIDPAKGAADAGRTVAAKSIGSASVQYSTYASTVEARARAATRLSDEALLILAEAGLCTPRAGTYR